MKIKRKFLWKATKTYYWDGGIATFSFLGVIKYQWEWMCHRWEYEGVIYTSEQEAEIAYLVDLHGSDAAESCYLQKIIDDRFTN